MSVTSGFFNSKNGDRKYNAEHFGSIFAGIIRDGVFANYPNTGDELKVTAVSGAMKVQVGPGRCWFKNTWLDNDSNLELTVPAADSSQTRKDAVVVDINLTTNVRKNDIKYVTGPLGGGNPTLVNSNGHYQYVLAYITVDPNATSIASSKIAGQVGTNRPTPYITGPLQTISADNVLAQWENAVNARIDAELYEKLAELSEDIPVQFLYANDGDVLSCSKTFEELFNAYYGNRNGLVALYRPLPRTKPEKRMYSRTYTMEAGETGDTYPIKAFNFYFYDAESEVPIVIRYTESSIENLNALSSGLTVTFGYNTNTGASCDASYLELSNAINNSRLICAKYSIGRMSYRSYNIRLEGAAIIFDINGGDVTYRFTVDQTYVSPTGIVDRVTYTEIENDPAPLTATFRSSPARCDVLYAELAAAIQAKQQVVLVYDNTYSSATHMRYTSDISLSNEVITAIFKLANGDSYIFRYASDSTLSMEYVRATDFGPLLITFSGGENNDASCDTSYDDILAAYNAGRELIAQFEDSGTVYRSMSYQVSSGPISFTFHFVAITASSGSAPSSWAYKVKSYRIMPSDEVYYTGN